MVPVAMQPVTAKSFSTPYAKSKKGPRITMPVHLTASVSLQAAGQSGVNEKALQNLFGYPMEILEIRFQILPASPVVVTGAIASCKLDLGDNPLTNGLVPLWSFCKSYNAIDEMGLNATNNVCNFNYKLPRPLWVAPGELVRPIFRNNGLGVTTNVTVRISYAGRIILSPEPPPKVRRIPWVCAYQSKPFDGFGAADSDQSTEDQLFNPFAVPVHVQRFVHRANIYDNTGSAVNHEYEVGSALTAYADFDDNLVQIRMMGSDGSPTIPIFSTVNTIFTKFTRSWECEHDLDPGAYYLVYLNKLAPGQLTAATYQLTEYFSMLGYREVPR